MHECPDCQSACDCDGDDVWNERASECCRHGCDESQGEGSLWDAWDDGSDDDDDGIMEIPPISATPTPKD